MKKQTLATKLHKSVHPVISIAVLIGAVILVIGVLYVLNTLHQQAAITQKQAPPSITSTQYACNSDADCALLDTSSLLCCEGSKCADYSLSTVKAVNASWLANQRQTLCRGTIECPMIPAHCSEQITAVQKSYKAKC